MENYLETALAEEFPQLFRDLYGDPGLTCMHWGITCNKGWFNLIKEVCQKLADLDINDLQFDQIKEKLGRLVIYTNYDRDERVRKITLDAWEKSIGICEFCGSTENVKQAPGHYIHYICANCTKKYYEQGNKEE